MDTILYQTAFVVLPISGIGFLLNWSVFYSFLRSKTMRHAFGYLSANQTLADALHSSAFFLYYCPMVLFDSQFMKSYSHFCGFLVMLGYEISLHSHLVISLNRFCAVWTPFNYPNIFNSKNTFRMIAALWLIVGSIYFLVFFYFCQWKFSNKTEMFSFTDTPLCKVLPWYADFVSNSVTVTIFMSFDVLTVIKVRQSRSSGNNKSFSISAREKRFLKQTLFQGSLYVLQLLGFYFVSRVTTNLIAAFFSGTVAFVSIHVLDGVIVLVYNPETRAYVFCRKRSPDAISVQQSRSNF